MGKGVIKITKTGKGKIIVALDRLNGRPPVPLSYVSFPDDKLNDKPCDYQTDSSGRITSIAVEGQTVFGKNFEVPAPPPQQPRQGHQQPAQGVARPLGEHPVHTDDFDDSFSLRESKLPRALKSLGIVNIDNFSLKYNRAARFMADAPGKNKFFFFRNDFRRRKDGSTTGYKFFIKPNYGTLDFKAIAARLANQVSTLFPDNHKMLRFSPDWRLICGLGGGIYETNMTLHHLYGVPYIPASSLKGVVRSWIITNVFDKPPAEEANCPMCNAEYRALKTSRLFCDLFGAPESIERVIFENNAPKEKKGKNETIKENSASGKEQQGHLVFMDALPVNAPTLMPDIMNPHYPDWYNGTALPTDYQNPNPILFLTVSKGSIFQTGIGVSTGKNKPLSEWPDFKLFADPVGLGGTDTLLDLAAAWLHKALSEHGVGAKTAIGYGALNPH